MSDFAKLRVLLVGPLPPPAGGMATQTRQLAELLAGAGAQVRLVQSNAPYRPAFVGRWPGVRALFRLLPYLLALWREAAHADVAHVMANSGWAWHLFAAPAIWIAWLRNVPVVVNYRGGEAQPFLRRSAAQVRITMRRAACLAVPSGFLQQVFQGHDIDAQVLPNIVDLTRFRPARQAQTSDPTPCLIVARNLEPIYDNATALRALAIVRARHAQAQLVIAGSGPERHALGRLAAELGVADAVRFCGRVERDEMARLLRASHVALNPSRVDNMPNSVLEALASGVPVVSTNVGGVPFIVADGVSALLVPPGEPEAMAAAVLRLLRDPALAERLVDAGMQEARRCSWEQVAPQLAQIYSSVRSARAEGATRSS